MTATTPLDPLISDFATQEEADSYDAWFRTKVQAALESDKPGIPHDEVMAKMWAAIEQHGNMDSSVR